MVRWKGIARLLRAVRPKGPCGVGGNTLIDLVNTNYKSYYLLFQANTKDEHQHHSECPSAVSKGSREVTCRRSKVVGFLRITRFVATATGG